MKDLDGDEVQGDWFMAPQPPEAIAPMYDRLNIAAVQLPSLHAFFCRSDLPAPPAAQRVSGSIDRP